MAGQNLAIRLESISKSFGSIIANNNINLTLKKGEILALLGENGSGKTTLMNMLSGIYKPDCGEIFVDGEKVSIHSPEDSKRLGIGMVHQHFKLVESFSAADNIIMASDRDSSAFLSKERFSEIKEISEKFGFEIDPSKLICDMSVSEKQTVEILKVLYNGANILILDEPTAVLTLQETRKLFSILRKMRNSGCAIIIITHKLNEVLEISDRVTILRKGKSISTVDTSMTNTEELTNLMVGRAVELSIGRPECNAGDTLLSLSGVSIASDDGTDALKNVSFEIKSGEIVGIAGVSGSGQKELCEAIAGLKPIKSGEIYCKNQRLDGKTPRKIIDMGISMSFIPEDRLGMGLAASLDITDNMLLKSYRTNGGIFVDRKSAKDKAERVIRDLSVVTPGTSIPVRRLSGGNVQKILLGREIQDNPNVIITAYPVRGLDINSSYTIYDILNEEKKKGTGVLFVGEDLDVMLELCDRIVVLCHGNVTGIFDAKKVTKEQLGYCMTNIEGETAQKADEKLEEKAEFDFNSENVTQKGKVKRNEPLLRMIKRGELDLRKSLLLYLLSVFCAIAIGGLFVLANGINPFTYYGTVITGCFKNAIYLNGFIRIIIPLIITSLGVAIAFKMKFWNVGANGQFIVGAVFASAAGLLVGNSLPQWLTLIIMAISAAVGAGLFGLIPALCKITLGTSETLMTLMFNYVAFYILKFLKTTFFFGKLNQNGVPNNRDFAKLPQNAWLYDIKIGKITIDSSLVIALLLVIIVFVYFKYTKHGYEVLVIGDSQNTARYAGMNVKKVIMRTMFFSSAVVGIAGMFQVSGTASSRTLSDGITGDVGWTGIIVAWLAKLNPFGIFVVSFLMAMLEKGSAVAESTLKIASSASDILQGIILFSVLAADFFTRYKISIRKSTKEGALE